MYSPPLPTPHSHRVAAGVTRGGEARKEQNGVALGAVERPPGLVRQRETGKDPAARIVRQPALEIARILKRLEAAAAM